MRERLRRTLGAVLVAATMAGGIVATAAPAGATVPATLSPSAWARIDSRAVTKTVTTGDALVGAWRDDRHRYHVAKSYFTFDLTGYRGREIATAGFIAPQLAAADCDKLAVELWRTEPVLTPGTSGPTWLDQPAELARLAGPDEMGCPTGQLGWDVSDAVASAVADGVASISFVLRVDRRHQYRTGYGRTFDSAPYLRLTYNTPPATPTDLRVAGRACTPARPIAPDFDGVPLSGVAGDPDGTYGLTARVEVWDRANPADVYAVDTIASSGTFGLLYPSSRITDGATYEWRARSVDVDGAMSEWSATCAFAVDRTAPEVPPTVESDYFVEDGGPPGATGPGEFIFTANGVADVVRFEWTGIGVPPGSVAADRPGGTATVTIMPTSDGPDSISVHSIDAAGNRSEDRTYRFWVASNAPETSLASRYYYAQQVPVTLTAVQPDAATFTYRFEGEDGQPEHTVPVGADGTASVTIEMPRSGPTGHDFTVWTATADGLRSQVHTQIIQINATAPAVGFNPNHVAVGETTTLIIIPDFFMGDDVVSYTWRVNGGPEHTAVPDPDGTVRQPFTPTESGLATVLAYANYAGGGISGTGFANLQVD